MARLTAPTLVERSLLVRDNDPHPASIDALLAYQRQGARIMLVTPRPKRWKPTRRSVDLDLALQQRLQHMFTRAGAELDGVLYLATSGGGRQSSAEEEFAHIARRYDRKINEIILIGNDRELIESMLNAGGQVVTVGDAGIDGARGFDDLGSALAALSSDGS